ncbi:MAG: hypothetical protein WDN02_14580 [Methylovirgula sp.]|uniref:hypothetical protein n=1 Tax=Methylovirgula sp. TaxID=1978224 RepID=UPI0030764D24
MLQFRIGIAVVILCALSTASFAQSSGVPTHTAHKAHAKKLPKTNDSVEDWDIAAPNSSKTTDLGKDDPVSEGRKKFFEQSTTMDNGGPGAPAPSKPGGGFTPSMGLSF